MNFTFPKFNIYTYGYIL